MIDDPGDPLGSDAHSIWFRKLLKWIRRTQVISITGALKKPQGGGGVIYEIQFPTIPPLASGWRWQTPKKELDPRAAVSKNVAVYISPNNPIVTTGLVDLTQGILLQAPAGVWLCVQAVPAQAVVGGVTEYNVPQLLAQGAVTGTPLIGDADAADVYWVPLGGLIACV